MKALVVDDEKLIVKGLKFSLEQEGYEVDCAYDGQEAVDKAKETEYDIVLLDLMLPILTGYEVCQQIREFSDMPIIMLTAKGDDMDKILGLEYGADDYITKPFNILEVKARIKAIIRRNKRKAPAKPEEPKVITSGKLKLDIDPGKIYGREQLLTLIWGSKYPGDARTVDVNVRRLREKVEENPAKPEYIHTKWGMGYYFQG